MICRQPAASSAGAQAERLKVLVAQGSSARVTVLANDHSEEDRVTDRQATRPKRGEDRPRGEHRRRRWVQVDGVIGMLAFARDYANLRRAAAPARWSWCSQALTTRSATMA